MTKIYTVDSMVYFKNELARRCQFEIILDEKDVSFLQSHPFEIDMTTYENFMSGTWSKLLPFDILFCDGKYYFRCLKNYYEDGVDIIKEEIDPDNTEIIVKYYFIETTSSYTLEMLFKKIDFETAIKIIKERL